MSVKIFVKERAEKRKLLSDIKKIIIKHSSKELKIFDKLNISTLDGVLELLINIGNMSYVSGDNDIFEYFIESLFDIIHADIKELNKEEIIKYIHNYGVVSAKDHDIIPYSIIIDNLKEYIFELKETKSINSYLRVLRDLALKSETNNYELGTLEALHVFRDLNEHFIEKNMHINRFYLKNIVISLISSTEISHHERLKNKVLVEANEILGFEPLKVQPDAVGTEPIRTIEEVGRPL